MHRTISFIGFLFLTSICLAQQAPRIQVSLDGPKYPWNHLEVNNAPETFQFAIVTDRTGGVRPGIFPDAVQKLNLLQPEFVMSVGDLITGYTTDTVELERQWDEFTGFIDQLQMPFFYLPGNHDITNPVMEKIWKEKFGATHYSFLYQDVLFLCLNSEDQARGAGQGSISEPQYKWIEQVLAENTEVKWTLVFMHQPLWNQKNPEMWPEVEKLLASRKHSVFVGHNHRYVKYERNNGKYFILATTGGGSRLRGPRFGEFDHVVWVTMTDEGPIMANLTLDGIWDEAVVTEEYANIFHELSRQDPLQIEPILMDGGQFQEGKTNFRLTNDSDFPMAVELTGTSGSELWAALDAITDTLAPNTIKMIEVPVRTTEAVQLDNLQVLQFEAVYTYLSTDHPEFRMESSYRFRPERQFSFAKPTKSIRVDGKLNDWPELRYQAAEDAIVDADPFSHQGPEDGSFAFDLAYGDTSLFIAVRVTDDQVEALDSKQPRRQDAIVLMLDPRPFLIAANSGQLNYGSSTLIISPAESKTGDANIYQREFVPAGFKAKSRRTSSGYEIEVAIPARLLNTMQGTDDWKHVRVNVAMRDQDQEGAHVTSLLWQPAWQSEDGRIGSGMFRKE